MTGHDHTRPPPELDALIVQLREEGYRITTPRRMVLDTLYRAGSGHGHYSCDAIAALLVERGLTIDSTTVYRILQWLKGLGIVTQTDVGAGHDVYSLVGEHPHHHLICLNCQQVINVDDALFAPLRDALREQHGFEARMDHFAIFGVCEHCQDAAD